MPRRRGDRAEARTLLGEALELARSKDLKLMVGFLGDSLGRETPSLPAGLTAREVETLRLLAARQTDKEIPFEPHITVETASNHVGSILGKIGAGNRTESARYASASLSRSGASRRCGARRALPRP